MVATLQLALRLCQQGDNPVITARSACLSSSPAGDMDLPSFGDLQDATQEDDRKAQLKNPMLNIDLVRRFSHRPLLRVFH